MLNVTRGQSINWRLRFRDIDITGGIWTTVKTSLTGYSIAITNATNGESRLTADGLDTATWAKGLKNLNLVLSLPGGDDFPVNLVIKVL